MKVKFKRYHKDAVIPTKAYKGDFCYDCYAVSEEEIAPNVWKYRLGFGLQIERGDETIYSRRFLGDSNVSSERKVDFSRSPLNLSIDIRPRSSVWKTGMVLSNCQGTVDEGFTNEISAVFYHVLKDMPRYRVGDKICQLKIGATLPVEFVEVEELDDTERGMRGYGSSDVNK